MLTRLARWWLDRGSVEVPTYRLPKEQYDAFMAALDEPPREIPGLRDLLDPTRKWRDAYAPCKEHEPSGMGRRSECLICVLHEFHRFFSRIDYLVGPPNDMNVSAFDVHCDPQLVVEAVERYVRNGNSRNSSRVDQRPRHYFVCRAQDEVSSCLFCDYSLDDHVGQKPGTSLGWAQQPEDVPSSEFYAFWEKRQNEQS